MPMSSNRLINNKTVNQLAKWIDESIHPLLIGKSQRILILDPPGYSNVGDSAIFVGELNYLDQKFPKSRLSFLDIENYENCKYAMIPDASVILLNGGGNFGDLYPRHHQLRLDVMRCFPEKTIIQLPQSIFFQTTESVAETAKAIADHGDFHLLVRDRNSLRFAEANFDCDTSLCPDMAFAMQPIKRTPALLDCFCLLRSDKEAAQDHGAIERLAEKHFGRSVASGDWVAPTDDILTRLDRYLSRMTRDHPRRAPLLMPLMLAVRRRFAERRLKAGIDMLSQGRVVIADRLHAHVLACLLDIEHYLLDSFDGKVSALFEAWTSEFPSVHFVDDLEQLDRELSRLNPNAV